MGGVGGGGVITFLLLRSLGLFFVTYFYVTLAGCRIIFTQHGVLSKKAGTQVIDRKWKALKDFLPSNYHRKINGPHGSQVNPRMRQRVFQFCWRNSLKWPSPAQFLKQLAKLQGKKL